MEPESEPIVSQLGTVLEDKLLLLAKTGKMGMAVEGGRHQGQFILVLQDGVTFLDSAPQITPMMREISTDNGSAAIYAARTPFFRHLELNHHLKYQLAREGKLLLGAEGALDALESYLQNIDPHQVYAQITAKIMDASAALVSEIMVEEEATASLRQLRRLTRQLVPGAETADMSPAMMFARLQQYLAPILAQLPLTQKWTRLVATPSQPLLPGLQSIYTSLDQTFLVFNALPGAQILQTDWKKLAQKVPESCKGIHVTTVAQFGLLLLYDRPLDIKLRKFRHTWGVDFLPSLVPERGQMVRHAARRPAQILVQELPHFYFNGENDKDEFQHHLIHEFQNKLLNIRLEHELLNRLGVVDAFELPGSLPGRESPSAHRIAALILRLDWWARSYLDLVSP